MGPEPIDFIDRWRRTVVARREQHDAICAEQGRTTKDYWARRAKRYSKFARDSGASDPFIDIVRRRLRPDDTLLDVGAGTGRHTLPLARDAKRVIALDPSQAMLGFLRSDAEAQGLTNVDVIEGGWPDAAAQVPRADVVICAHVLYPIEDVVSFLRALDAQAGRDCFVAMMGEQPWFDRLGLWKAVHGEERRPQPVYIDAVNVLQQLGCYANVEVTWVDSPRAFADLDDAFEAFAETVAVGEDPKRQRRLRDALEARLTPADDGKMTLNLDRHPVAAISWEAGALQS